MYFRRGKITGSRLKEIYSKRDPDKRKIGFYELVAEKLGLPPDDGETAMERGTRLEEEAVDRYAEVSGKEIDKSLLIWFRDDDENIAISPDGVIWPHEAVEAKCLSSARHIEAYIKKNIDKLSDFEAIPDDYQMQAVQYFIVNDDLQTLHFVFYDPRFAMYQSPEQRKKNKLEFFWLDVKREDVQPLIEEYLTFERRTMGKVNEIVNQLTF